MAEQVFLKQLKELVSCYYIDGEVLASPSGILANKIVDSDINDFLIDYVNLLINTNFLTEEGKIYISDRYITYRGVAQKLSNIELRDVNVNTVQSKVFWDKNKILRYFGDSFYADLVDKGDKGNLDYLRASLKKAYKKYGYDNILQTGLTIKLPDTDDSTEIGDISEDRFNEFISIILPYTNKQVKEVSKHIDKEMIRYCRDLLNSGSSLGEEELGRRQLLLDMLR